MLNKKFLLSLSVALSVVSSSFTIYAYGGYDYNSYNYGYNTTTTYSYDYSYNNGYSYGSAETTTDSNYDALNDYSNAYINDNDAVEVIQEQQEEFTDLTYTIKNDQVTITGYNPDLDYTYYTIPSVILGYPVTNIGEYAFKDCTSLVNLVVPNTVKNVDAYAFSGCANLQNIQFETGYSNSDDDEDADTTTNYDYNGYGFYNETTQASYNYYGYQTTDTTEVTTMSTEVNEGITVDHSGLVSIMQHAFDGCVVLESITVPDSLVYLGNYAINDTPYYTQRAEKLENVTLGSVFYKYFPEYTYSYQYNENTAQYEQVVNTFDEEVPEGIVSISSNAFSDIEGLSSVTFPESLRTIYDKAFYNCTDLAEVNANEGIQYVGEGAFTNTAWIDECEGGFAVVGDYLYKYVGKGGTVSVPAKVKIVGNEAFALNSNVTRIEVQNGTEKIMGGAFYRCENLQTAVISGSVLSIGNQAFYGCKNLAMITFNDGLLSIGEKCFVSCSGLKYAIIPKSVTQIGDMAFGFEYNDIHTTYSMIDGFTLVGEKDSTAQEYAQGKTLNFQTTDTFEVPKAQEVYSVVNDDEEVETPQPVDTKIILAIVGGLVGLLVILSLILYLVDRKKHPKKYRKKKKKKKKSKVNK